MMFSEDEDAQFGAIELLSIISLDGIPLSLSYQLFPPPN
jgi:hypothetical protein